MKVSAWLVLEMKIGSGYTTKSGNVTSIKIKDVRQNRPMNEMAVHVVLDIEPGDLQPLASTVVSSEHVSIPMEVEELEDPIIRVRKGSDGTATD